MRIPKTLYTIITEDKSGGQSIDSYLKEDSALKKADEIIEHIKKSNRKGFKVYLSELDYDSRKNRILSDEIINNESELLFRN